MIHVIYRDEKIRYNAYHLGRAFWPEEAMDTYQEPIDRRVRILRDGEPEPLTEADDIPELYDALNKLTGKELPWGMLTGVRPTKLAMKWIREHPAQEDPDGGSDRKKEAFLRWFYEERRVSTEKASLAYDIAVTEQKLLKDLDLRPERASLYIGIPFCPSVCRYCSFSSGSIERYAQQVDPYLSVLIAEMEKKKKLHFPGQAYPVTVYIGGGTPTSLNHLQLEQLLEAADRIFHVRQGLAEGMLREYTVEAGRPDSLDPEKLKLLKAYGVTRISVNPQSMNQNTLDAIGRNHSVEQTRKAFDMAREAGFDNINMDLIMGLPGETLADVQYTLEQIRQMAPDSLTVHSLAIKRASAMGMDPHRPHKEDEEGRLVGSMIDEAYAAALSMGMHPYYLYRQKQIAGNFENIGYALPGKECYYNILIMEEVQSIIACGAGATTKIVSAISGDRPEQTESKARITRTENVKNIEEYIRRGAEGSGA